MPKSPFKEYLERKGGTQADGKGGEKMPPKEGGGDDDKEMKDCMKKMSHLRCMRMMKDKHAKEKG